MGIKISIVSYINSYPFLFGLSQFKNDYNFELMLYPPAQCAQTTLDNTADIALIPTAAIPLLSNDYEINSHFCIGAEKSVSSVLLLSNSPLQQIKKIFIDTHSMTSAKLLKVLINNYWHISTELIKSDITHNLKIKNQEAIMAIGDKCFDLRKQYTYSFDLFDEWYAFTKLPMVFAVWVNKKILDKQITDGFNDALFVGISHKTESLHSLLPEDKKRNFDFYLSYITQNINYIFDKEKQKAVSIYLNYIKNID